MLPFERDEKAILLWKLSLITEDETKSPEWRSLRKYYLQKLSELEHKED